MNRPLSSRRWLQFRLCSLLLLGLLVAIALSGWQYWRQTRHMWRLQWAIAEYLPSDSEEAKLLRQLTWDREAWDSGLIDALGRRVHEGTRLSRAMMWHESPPRLVWSGVLADEAGSNYRLYLFEQGSTFDTTGPLACLVTDGARRFEMWQHIAERNYGFASAAIVKETPPVLQIRCRRGFTGWLRYDYLVTKGAIVLVDEVECEEDDLPVEEVVVRTAK